MKKNKRTRKKSVDEAEMEKSEKVDDIGIGEPAILPMINRVINQINEFRVRALYFKYI